MSDEPTKIPQPDVADGGDFDADDFIGDSQGSLDPRLGGADASAATKQPMKKQTSSVNFGGEARTVGGRPSKAAADSPAAGASLEFGVYDYADAGASEGASMDAMSTMEGKQPAEPDTQECELLLPSLLRGLQAPPAKPAKPADPAPATTRKSGRQKNPPDNLKSSTLTAKGNCRITAGASAAAAASSKGQPKTKQPAAASQPTEAPVPAVKKGRTPKAKKAREAPKDVADAEIADGNPFAVMAVVPTDIFRRLLRMIELIGPDNHRAIFQVKHNNPLTADDEVMILTGWRMYMKHFHPDKVEQLIMDEELLTRATAAFQRVNIAKDKLMQELYPDADDSTDVFAEAMAAFAEGGRGERPTGGAGGAAPAAPEDETMEYNPPDGEDSAGGASAPGTPQAASDDEDAADGSPSPAVEDDYDMAVAGDAGRAGGTPDSAAAGRDFLAEMAAAEAKAAAEQAAADKAAAEQAAAEQAAADEAALGAPGAAAGADAAPPALGLTAREAAIAAGAPCSLAEGAALKAKLDATSARRVVPKPRKAKSKPKRKKGWTAVGYKKPASQKRHEKMMAAKKKTEQRKRFVMVRDAESWRDTFVTYTPEEQEQQAASWLERLGRSEQRLLLREQAKQRAAGGQLHKAAVQRYMDYNEKHDAFIFMINFAMFGFPGIQDCRDHVWCYHEYWSLVNSGKQEWKALNEEGLDDEDDEDGE